MVSIPSSTSPVTHEAAQALSTLLLDERWQTMEEKAATLFEDGYRIAVLAVGVFSIRSPQGHTYRVNWCSHNCSCVSYGGGKIRDEEGVRTCKHLEGLWRLAAAQSRWYGQRRQALWSLLPTLDAWDRLAIHMGATPDFLQRGPAAQAWSLITRLERAQCELQALHANLLLCGDMWLPDQFEKFIPVSLLETKQEAM